MKRIIFFLLALKLSFVSFGQLYTDLQTPKIVPPSPDAAALGKYGQIPVDRSTGIPSISIPIYEIKTPRFTLPISLSYHASGIKVEEISSWVGAGWSLNAGGLVTRSIMGYADDGNNGFLTNQYQLKKAADIQWPADILYISKIVTKEIDNEPDNFSYNFNNHAGSFVFGDNATPVLIPFAPIKINFNQSTKIFDIKDEFGNSYYFSTKENTVSDINTNMSGITSWYLTKMVSADLSDEINFYYTTDETYQTDFSYNFSQSINQCGTGVRFGLDPMTKVSAMRTYYPVRISSIQFKGGKVDFIAQSGRLDEANKSLDEVIIYNLNPANNQYTKLKSFKLLQDYFYSTWTVPSNFFENIGERNKHRLKFAGLQEKDANNAVIATHSFEYNSTELPWIHCFAQDNWGYFNGQVSNLTLLETRNVVIDPLNNGNLEIVTIGSNGSTNEGANRSVSEQYMQAGSLTKITYPTKGYTTFSYECNKKEGAEQIPGTFIAGAVGIHQENVTTNYTPSNDMLLSGGTIFHIKIKKGDAVSQPLPSVKIIRVSDANVIYSLSADSNPNITIDKYLAVSLTGGVAYQLVANAQGGSSPTSSNLPLATISTTCQIPSGSNVIKMGGLRVSSIKNYNSDGQLASTETYKYGTASTLESGGGVELAFFPIYHFNHTIACTDGGYARFVTLGPNDTYTNTSYYPLSTLNGSPVGYPAVTIFKGDNITNIGKSVFKYDIFPDSIFLCSSPFWNGVKPLSVSWKNGDPTWEGHYRYNGSNQYTIVKEIANAYYYYSRDAGRCTVIGYNPEPFGTIDNCSYFVAPFLDNGAVYSAAGQACEWHPYWFYWFDYPILTGTRALKQSIIKDYGPDGIANVQTTANYYYDNLKHAFPTRIETSTSTGDTRIKQISYPQDMVAASEDPTGIYAAMVSANMVSPQIKVVESKNSTQLLKTKTNYAFFNSTLIEPQSVEVQNKNNPSEIRLKYHSYDVNGNLQTVSKDNAAKISYQWGYNRAYPIAMITNSPGNNFFHENFEDGNGNSTTNDSKTGHLSHTGAYSKALSGLDNGPYKLTYWQKSGSSWAYIIINVNVSGNAYTISVNAQIDDVCFYPASAQITTYTYDPLVGITSQTDPNGIITYFEYDAISRLTLVRNKDKNIIKKICYSYAGQVENCQ
jgi:YD repeat-containing protein